MITDPDVLLIETLGTNFAGIQSVQSIQQYSCWGISLSMSCAKTRSLCLGLNILVRLGKILIVLLCTVNKIHITSHPWVCYMAAPNMLAIYYGCYCHTLLRWAQGSISQRFYENITKILWEFILLPILILMLKSSQKSAHLMTVRDMCKLVTNKFDNPLYNGFLD